MNRISVKVCVVVLMVFVGSARADDIKAPAIKAIAFDAFPIFDPRPVAKLAEEAFPGQGKALMEAWRASLFEYQWLRALGGKYENFMEAAESSLVFATRKLGLDLTPDKKSRLLSGFLALEVWPDVPASIEKLNEMGLQIVFLSNMTEVMLRNGLEKSGLDKEFSHVISTDSIRSYKPDPKAYQLAPEKLKLKKEEILFVAFAGWDVAGAKWYGFPTFWLNRLESAEEELGVVPDGESKDLSGLIAFVKKKNQNE